VAQNSFLFLRDLKNYRYDFSGLELYCFEWLCFFLLTTEEEQGKLPKILCSRVCLIVKQNGHFQVGGIPLHNLFTILHMHSALLLNNVFALKKYCRFTGSVFEILALWIRTFSRAFYA